jgi:hypothetical protein
MIRRFLLLSLCLIGFYSQSHAQEMPLISGVERQPFIEATKRLSEALEFSGAPLSQAQRAALESAYQQGSDNAVTRAIQETLDPLCLAFVHINPESRVKVAEGPVDKELLEQGWRTFLVKVHNEEGINPQLRIDSPNAGPVYMRGKGSRQKPQSDKQLVTQAQIDQRFLDLQLYDRQPLKPKLSGLQLEYRIVQLYSRDAGNREAQISFNIGQGTQDIGFRNSVPILFKCLPAVNVVLGIKDHDGSPTTAALVIRDEQNRIYPNPARRLAPDFFFHNQVYRADGESLSLPPGNYSATVSRGPEYLSQTQNFTVGNQKTQRVAFALTRWIHPMKHGWYSGDHHVHAAGCAHYDSPTEGVAPEDMLRHIVGEDLNVGCVLTWGPCWYFQKQYFEGKPSELSQSNSLMRYDVEVSGFPSSHAGHLCLLRLKEDDYPGTKLIEEWPSWTLPVLKWGQEQGGVVGYSHSGWGLGLPDYDANKKRVGPTTYPRRSPPEGRAADTLPDYAIPPFDGIGANEYIVTAPHGVCDFISAVDTPSIWELNIWYHTLNCGITTRISGETDFPCIYGDKVGLGRIYVNLPKNEPLTFDNWAAGLKAGRSYCGDGLSHIFKFKVNDFELGEVGESGAASRLDLEKSQKVKVTFDVAALLEKEPSPETERIRNSRLDQKPYWHLERSRIQNSRQVPVELIVNGQAVATKQIEADGDLNNLEFEVDLKQSSWVAVRILPSIHTNPIFVHIDNQPIHASKKSAEWCRKSVDVCWKAKSPRIRESEQQAAKEAYDFARSYYDKVRETASED